MNADTGVYLDSSAIVKLIVDEAESEVLRSTAERWERRATSALSRVEVARALRRLGVQAARGRQALLTISLLAITDDILDAASGLDPFALRSLDAIHLASAVSFGDDLSLFVSYDGRLLGAAAAAGMPVLAPR